MQISDNGIHTLQLLTARSRNFFFEDCNVFTIFFPQGCSRYRNNDTKLALRRRNGGFAEAV